MDLVYTPVRVATSKPARQTYLNTLLFLTTSSILAIFAVIAYTLFYFNYIPQIGVERIIHLQYGDGPHPYGVAQLDSSIVAQQPYDISLSLHVPRSPPNLAQGNFMLTLSLLRASYIPPNPALNQRPKYPRRAIPAPIDDGPTSALVKEDTILTSRRPAILTYSSWLVSLAERVVTLPLYVLGWRRESEVLHIPMVESKRFGKGRGDVPGFVLLELQGGQEVQVYDVRVHFKARFEGLRWLMYNHRIISFVVFSTAFWLAEVLFTIFGWLALRSIFDKPEGRDIKQETKREDTDGEITTAVKTEYDDTDEPDLSDTPRTFPTYGRQRPLRYEPKVKDEDSEEYGMDETTVQPMAAEADDEDEDVGGYEGRANDSGLGTSFSESGGRGITRRRSRVGG